MGVDVALRSSGFVRITLGGRGEAIEYSTSLDCAMVALSVCVAEFVDMLRCFGRSYDIGRRGIVRGARSVDRVGEGAWQYYHSTDSRAEEK